MKKIWRYKSVRVVVYFHLVALVFLLVGISHIVYKTNKNYEAAVAKTPFDAVIVPGLPFQDGTWSTLMKMRVYWAVYLYENGLADHIIFSGSAVYSPYVESKIMKAYAVAAGVPEEKIFIESRAEHSTENLYYAYHLAHELGFENIALATDPFQSYFLTFFATGKNLDIAFLPFRQSVISTLSMDDQIIATEDAFIPNFEALPDRQGYYDRFRGTLGRYIQEEKRQKDANSSN